MAQDNHSANLDLAQILQTLANLPPIPNVAQQNSQEGYDPTQLTSIQPSSGSIHDYRHPPPFALGHQQTQDPRSNGGPALQHRHPPPNPQARSSTPTIDPSTITEWKHGLRCVNKIASSNPNFVASVQKLIKDQEQNLKAWAAGRERLIEEQVAKRENEKKSRAALSLPGILDGTTPLRTPERERDEQNQYNQKVYRASRQMVESHFTALKGLGVPFFGVKPDLVLADDAEPSEPNEDAESKPSTSTNGKITKKEVLELQRKMLNHLMEMYGD